MPRLQRSGVSRRFEPGRCPRFLHYAPLALFVFLRLKAGTPNSSKAVSRYTCHRTPNSLLDVTLRTALGIRAGDFCSQVGPRFDGGVVTGKAIGVISDFVVEL